MFTGSCVALVTPFKNGKVDEKKIRELVDFHVEHRTSALVPCGSTGESATLTYAEHYRVIEIVVKHARGRIPVIAGTGSNSTAEAVMLTRHAKTVGADAALVIVPYYNKPTQEGMIAHFSHIAKTVAIPIIIYNIPSRTGVNLLPSTLVKIVEKNKNIVGVKESSQNLEQVSEITAALAHRDDFSVFSGDDSLTLPILAVGGKGVISVAANIIPRDVQDLCLAFSSEDLDRARQLHQKMVPLIKALFIETNPAPIKAAMEHLGICSSEMRLPMSPLLPENKAKLLIALKQYGLRRSR